MALELLGAPPGAVCTLSSGGTESNFLAVMTARNWARVHRPAVAAPEIVMPYTAHPTLNKAAGYLGLKVVRVPVGPDYRADVPAMEAAVGPNTVMLVGSAPPYSHGRIDPVAALGELALRRELWLHVDACVGGFLAPFLRKLGRALPEFDLAVPGVTSISADLHKFGYCLLGASTFSLRDASLRAHQQFDFDEWPYGPYRSVTFAGSRPSSPVAAAWAVLRLLGEDGYLEIARSILRTTELFVEGVRGIDGLSVLFEPEIGVLNVVSSELDVIAVADELTAGAGPPPASWSLPPFTSSWTGWTTSRSFGSCCGARRGGWRRAGGAGQGRRGRWGGLRVRGGTAGAVTPVARPAQRRAPSSREILPKAADDLHLLEPESAVRRRTQAVLGQGVGREFTASAPPRPHLGGLHERAADALPATRGRHVPSLEESHRAGLAALGVRAA